MACEKRWQVARLEKVPDTRGFILLLGARILSQTPEDEQTRHRVSDEDWSPSLPVSLRVISTYLLKQERMRR